MTKQNRKKRKYIDPEKFIQAWYSSETQQEVADKIGISRQAVSVKKYNLIRKGIKLKKLILYTSITPQKVKELNALITELEGKTEF